MSKRGEVEDRDLRDRLRGLRVDPPDGDFQASLRRRLLAAGPPLVPTPWQRLGPRLERPRRVVWPVAGIAAGVLAFFALARLHAQRVLPDGQPPGYVTLLPATKVAVVHLNLSASVAVESAHILVTLPPELAFWVNGQELPQRAFEWTQPLTLGDNEIPIAVRGQRPGRYRIAVSARIGDERVVDEVFLEVVGG